MLTDILAYRYLDHPIWSSYTDLEQRLLNQAFGVVKDALPYYNVEGKVIEASKAKWKTLHDRIARELGVKELALRYYSYTKKGPLGQDWPVQGWFEWDSACEQFVTAKFSSGYDADRFVKERLSFVELAMRLRHEEIEHLNASLPLALKRAAFQDGKLAAIGLTRNGVADTKALNATINAAYKSQVAELNERFRRARAPLTYHNGFIQVSLDEKIEQYVAKPFWDIVADPMWENVDIDMKEALDRRDSNDKDPAIFAAKALESALKIVSKAKGWTRGTETGASSFVDNLVSKANGGFLAVWEGDILKDYFRKVRNPLGHGPGSDPMPALNLSQTDWAIETAMSWVRSLVRRM
jgi:AbiJ N-terminal domain 4